MYRNQGLGQKTVKEIRELAERLAAHIAQRSTQPPSVPSDELEPDTAPGVPQWLSVDLMARQAVPRRIEADEQHVLRVFLGLDPTQESAWLARQDVAERLGLGHDTVQRALQRARERWGRQPWMTALREDIAILLDKSGGVMTTDELTAAVLTARGSTLDGPDRSRFAAAVAYAAVATEAVREGARYTLYRGPQRVFVTATPALADHYTAASTGRAQWAERLGACADALAAADPLLTPTRVTEELQALPRPEGEPPMPLERLLRLAVAASQHAALSSRMEIYPQRMEAARALKLGVGSLLGPKALTVQQIRQRIASRYPQAEPVPGLPMLDDLLQETGIALVWDSTQSVYSFRPAPLEASSATSSLQRLSTTPGPGVAVSPEVEAARALEARLTRAVTERRFLLLTVAPSHLLRAEAEIVRRFAVQRLSLEAVLLREMQATAAAVGAQWDVVLQADTAPLQSTDWRNLQTLVRRAMPAIEQTLLAAHAPVLLVYPGLLARYDQLKIFDRLRDACTQQHDAPGFIVLVASDAQRSMPVLDGKPIPVLQPSEWARIPESWLTNVHRAQEE